MPQKTKDSKEGKGGAPKRLRVFVATKTRNSTVIGAIWRAGPRTLIETIRIASPNAGGQGEKEKIASHKKLDDALGERARALPTPEGEKLSFLAWSGREQIHHPTKGEESGKPIEVTDESGKTWVLEPLDLGGFIISPAPSQGEEKPSKKGSGQDKKSE